MNKPAPVHNIGSYVPMIDGPEKVSGRAKYTADIVGVGQLVGCIYRSPYAHGEIVDVDVSEALKVPGVVAIVTGADCDRTFGVLPIARSEHPLARDKVRYRGEPVAAVAAVDDVAARKAIRLIKMTVKELPAYFTAKDALSHPVASSAVYLSFRATAGGGSAAVGSTALTSTPSLFKCVSETVTSGFGGSKNAR